jgi:hypothetical protein
MNKTVAALLLFTWPTVALAGPIAPHRAIYELELDGRDQNSKLAAVEGRLAFEISEAGCDGWTVNFRMANRYSPIDGEVRLVDTQSTSYEAADGSVFDYSEKTYVNQKLDDESRLKVTREQTGTAGEGKITVPETKGFTVEPDVIFPIGHQLRVMESARTGSSRDASMVFDGSEKDLPIRTITFIGKEKAAGVSVLDADNRQLDPLRKLKAWPVSMSYYETGEGEQDVPNYSIAFDIFENGVASGLRMDYGAFRMKGTLSQLEMFEPEKCD